MSALAAWWDTQSLREKWLVGSAAVLFAIVILWQAILVPGFSWRANQKAQAETAFRSLETIQQAYFRERAARQIIVVDSEKRKQLTGEPFKSAIVSGLQEAGLSVSRLQTGGPNIISVTVDQADPRLVFYWLQTVEVSAGANITRLVLEPSADNQIRVSVDFEASVS